MPAGIVGKCINQGVKMDELKACQCGRKAIKTTERLPSGGLTLCLTTIRCEGKTEATKEQPGCNMRCSASDDATAVRIWNTRTPELPEFNDEVKGILGRPNFTCASIAQVLRMKGQKIKTKAEDEQAAVLYWMLSMYMKHGNQWKAEGEAYLKIVQTGKPAPK